MVAPLDDILKTACSVFFERQFQFCELTYWTHKTYCSPSATTKSSSPQTRAAREIGWSPDFCASLWQSDIFIAKHRLEKMQNKIAKLQKKKKRNGGGGEGEEKKQKAPFPLLIEFKGITCSTLQQMGSYTNFKAIKRYKVPCGAGLHWS